MTIDVTSCQQQWSIIDMRSKPFQPTYSASDPTSVLTVVTSAKQQEELLSRCEPAPKGTNQEASQQVFGQSSVPLSTVAMEMSNQGGAACQGSGCVVTVRERQSRAGKRTEGESETGAEEGQKESGLEKNKAVGQLHGGGLLRYSKTVQIREQKTEKYNCGVCSKHIRHTRMECDSCDDSQSDSGVSADFSPCSTLEGSTTITTGCTIPATVPKETPIEREIRRAIEREQSLRRSRGLPNPPTSPEYVDIPLRKTVLSQSLPAKSERCQGKDRQFAGKKMQHDIHEEAQREQDLVKLGKVPGFYDKGTVRQLKEKKLLFEAFQKPSDATVTISCRSKPTSWSSASDISTLENQEDISTPASTLGGSDVKRRRSLDLLSPTKSTNSDKIGDSTSLTPQGPGFSEGTSCQVIILENNPSIPAQRLYGTKPGRGAETAVDSGAPYVSPGGIIERVQEKEEEEEMAPKENPFFKLRSSTNLVKVEQDIREAQEREKELQKQRISLYGGTGGAKEGVGVGEARQLVGKISVWPPAQAEEEKINRPEVRSRFSDLPISCE
ncbi:hypothetical protein PAMP_020919 [Pampus punctatissimus]